AEVAGSSVVNPMNSTSRPLYSLRTFSYSGTSLRHGPHHDAQRFTTMTLPWKSASLKLLLSSALIRRSRTLSGISINGPADAGRVSGSRVSAGSGVSEG